MNPVSFHSVPVAGKEDPSINERRFRREVERALQIIQANQVEFDQRLKSLEAIAADHESRIADLEP